MKTTAAALAMLVFAGFAGAQPDKTDAIDALQAEIDALKPAKHVWRAIDWKTCPLEALSAARKEKKPILLWVFLGVPTDERC